MAFHEVIKSPIYYTGNKYTLIPMLLKFFPKDRKYFIDAFGGSGIVALNAKLNADFESVQYNEIEPIHFNLFKLLTNGTIDRKQIEKIWKEYPIYNKDDFYNFRDNVLNPLGWDDYKFKLIYYLSYYSFCNIIRFNKKNLINIPSGGMDIKSTASPGPGAIPETKRTGVTEKKLDERFAFDKPYNIKIDKYTNGSYEDIVIENPEETFVYFDPPYANTGATYNDGWNLEDDHKLFAWLDKLTAKGVKWGMSNVLAHRGKLNDHIRDWYTENNYNVEQFEKTYQLAREGKTETVEIYVYNYEADVKKQISLFE